jgi:hypothetical protein
MEGRKLVGRNCSLIPAIMGRERDASRPMGRAGTARWRTRSGKLGRQPVTASAPSRVRLDPRFCGLPKAMQARLVPRQASHRFPRKGYFSIRRSGRMRASESNGACRTTPAPLPRSCLWRVPRPRACPLCVSRRGPRRRRAARTPRRVYHARPLAKCPGIYRAIYAFPFRRCDISKRHHLQPLGAISIYLSPPSNGCSALSEGLSLRIT